MYKRQLPLIPEERAPLRNASLDIFLPCMSLVTEHIARPLIVIQFSNSPCCKAINAFSNSPYIGVKSSSCGLFFLESLAAIKTNQSSEFSPGPSITTPSEISSEFASISFHPFVRQAHESSIEPVIETPAATWA